jgi:hypothetical protein
MGTLTSVVTLLLAVITLSTAAGVGFQRGKIGQLRGEVNEQTERADRLTVELSESRHETAGLRRDLDALGRVVTGEAHWVAIAGQLETHHEAAAAHWTAQQASLDRLASILERQRP